MSFCIVVLLVNMCICHLYNKLTYLLTYTRHISVISETGLSRQLIALVLLTNEQ